MWSMWNAPSDRDYYDPEGGMEQEEEPEFCLSCYARWNQACEEWCETNRPASEPAPVDGLTPEPNMVTIRGAATGKTTIPQKRVGGTCNDARSNGGRNRLEVRERTFSELSRIDAVEIDRDEAEKRMRLCSVYVFVCLCGHEIESAELDCECRHCGRMLEVNWRCEPNGNHN